MEQNQNSEAKPTSPAEAESRRINPLVELENGVLRFWQEKRVLKKLLASKRRKKFVFYEGPPTANAAPGFHHGISRSFKDIIPRYKGLKGFQVLRKAGWDTHGLPVELQIEKEINTRTKADIEKYGIDKFNRKCQESVWRFKQDWDRFTERLGFWLDLENPYITYDTNYIESVWWLLKKIWQKGLLEEDYKIVHYCSRCGTPLSSHEVAQGYQEVEDESIYVKFAVKDPKFKNAFFLVWTTTPWTLPGNVALAINPKLEYALVELKESKERLILATRRLGVLTGEHKVLQELKGKELLGLRYDPIFDYLKKAKPQNIANAFQTLSGEFATDEDGTGIVHTAVMYGEEDFALGKKFKLPQLHTVGENGKFLPVVEKWKGEWVKDADPKIIKFLAEQKILYKSEKIVHTYPFCWRCKTPLLFYAHHSWFIRMSQLRKQLMANNQKINWEPKHLQTGRFGEWLKDNKDWALSRERYWGTPLPVWQCEKDVSHRQVIGSLAELQKLAWQPNTYYLLRHGQADSNVKYYCAGWPEKTGQVSHLTEKGKRQVQQAALGLKKEKPDLIVSSDLIRCEETVRILQKQLPTVKVIFDSRLREVRFGVLDYGSMTEFDKMFTEKGLSLSELYLRKSEQGESYYEVGQRMFEVVQDLEKKYQGKKILILSHGGPLWVLEGKLRNLSLEETYRLPHLKTAESKTLRSLNLPYNEKLEVDLHRPFIDSVVLTCPSCGHKMRRVKEVIDVWFDSGAMPYAQFHFPFAFLKKGQDPLTVNYRQLVKRRLPFPADYISEAIDQTRGWFYTLLAIATTLELGPAYKNVVCMGHILDEKGEKMSKSKGNIVNPWDMLNRYGADSLRWYFYTVNSPGDYKKFSEKDLGKSSNELLVVLNVLNFFRLYAPQQFSLARSEKNLTVLQKWALAKFKQTLELVDTSLGNYKIFEAARTLQAFYDDLSRWYLRRSRKYFQKAASKSELEQQAAFLGKLLLNLASLMAPFSPFLAEEIWQAVKIRVKSGKFAESVHLGSWPKVKPVPGAKALLEQMELVREIAALVLKIRAEQGIKVRQPLSQVQVKLGSKPKVKTLTKEVLEILQDEVNVKKVSLVAKLSSKASLVKLESESLTLALDTEITGELRLEGQLRDLARAIQEKRQEQNLNPNDKATAEVVFSGELGPFSVKQVKALQADTSCAQIELHPGRPEEMRKLKLGAVELEIRLTKLN